jgi:hypothetical protein
MKKTLIFLLIALTATGLNAQKEKGKNKNKSSGPTVFEILTKEEGVKITMETDVSELIAQKRTNNYLPAVLHIKDGKSFQVQIKPRGKFRRKISPIPPFKIKFDKKGLELDSMSGLNEIKVVLPMFGNDRCDELIIREYLAYKMFEKAAPKTSVCARLVRLTLKDNSGEKTPTQVGYAIFVEDEEEMAKRVKGQPITDQYGIGMDAFDTKQAALTAVFQYMVGNTDWDFGMLRNVSLLKLKETGKILAVPYDFDFAGFVDAPYAVPSSESKLKSVKDRYLMAKGLSPEDIAEAVRTLKSVRNELNEVCRNKLVPKSASKDMIAYLDTFFEAVEQTDSPPPTLVLKK